MRRNTLALIALWALVGCNSADVVTPELKDHGYCLMYAIAGITVRVKDSVTGAWAASGSQLTISTRTFGHSEYSYVPADRTDRDSMPLVGAWERPGVFELRVQKPGYRDWVAASVEVEDGGCHVIPVNLTALLQH